MRFVEKLYRDVFDLLFVYHSEMHSIVHIILAQGVGSAIHGRHSRRAGRRDAAPQRSARRSISDKQTWNSKNWFSKLHNWLPEYPARRWELKERKTLRLILIGFLTGSVTKRKSLNIIIMCGLFHSQCRRLCWIVKDLSGRSSRQSVFIIMEGSHIQSMIQTLYNGAGWDGLSLWALLRSTEISFGFVIH